MIYCVEQSGIIEFIEADTMYDACAEMMKGQVANDESLRYDEFIVNSIVIPFHEVVRVQLSKLNPEDADFDLV